MESAEIRQRGIVIILERSFSSYKESNQELHHKSQLGVTSA